MKNLEMAMDMILKNMGYIRFLLEKVFRLNWTNINQKYGITDLC